MFCPNCGNCVKDEATSCSMCGYNLSTTTAITVAKSNNDTDLIEKPIQNISEQQKAKDSDELTPKCEQNTTETSAQSFDTQNSKPAKRLGKLKYIHTLGSKKIKTLSIIVWALFLIVAIVLSLSVNTFLTAQVTSIPVIEIVIPVVEIVIPDGEIKEFINEAGGIDNLLDQADDILDEIEGEISSSEFKIVKNVLDDTKKFIRVPNIITAKQILNHISEVSKIAQKYPEYEMLPETFNTDDIINNIETPVKIFDFAFYSFIGFIAFTILMALIAAAFKKTGFALFALILSLLFCVPFAGLTFAIISAILFITIMVLCMIINKEYKTYRKSFNT